MRRQEKDKSKVILGIDPGSVVCGYGVIRTTIRNSVRSETPGPRSAFRRFFTPAHDSSYISSGRIMLSPKHSLNIRLKELFDGLTGIIGEYRPDEVAVENVFFAKGIRAALTLGHARGAVLVAAGSCGLPVYEYSALEVKKAVVGYGRAEKHQVQEMVARILNLKTRPSGDSADALALALCHANTFRY